MQARSLERLGDERVREQLRSRRSLEVVEDERLVEEVDRNVGDVGRERRTAGSSDLKSERQGYTVSVRVK